MTMREFETLSVDEQHEQLNKLLQQHHIHGKTIVEIAEYFDKGELTQAQQGVWGAIRRRWKGFGWI